MNKQGMLEHRLRAAMANYRHRVIATAALKALPTFQLALIAALLGELSLPLMLAGSLGVYLVSSVVLFVTSPARHISPEAFLLHLNRSAPELEESAQLFARETATLNLLQRLQRDRIAPHLEALLAAPKRWLPAVAPAWPLVVSVLLLVLALTLHLAGPLTLFKQAEGPDTATGTGPVTEIEETPSLLGAEITVTPPSYTTLPATMSQSLDISALEGSEIVINARFSDPDATYRLKPSLGEAINFEGATNTVTARLTASSTFLYQFVQVKDGEETLLDGIHTLTVERDQKPAVRIIEPKSTTVEFAKNATPVFTLVAHISDDFAIASTQILASVAKGTGEAVKFRDEVFAFDQSAIGERQDEYVKNWDLHKIGMEPGDELYFSVTATDNREPEANTVKSATVIVRWLDDVETPLGAEGIVSDFVPEYFKSQRQIIIETERLIADRPVLDDTTFRQTSYGLGQAQSDLKQRYGQYLGDEFGEGPGDQLAAVSDADEHEDHAKEEHEDHEDEAAERPEIGHDHGSENTGGRSLTGAAELVARFGHAHEDADIGPIARQDPKTLMKKAVSIMWQAELHLMLAEPEKALPFEYEALKFLKLAKQADRIYVKRLGFEPPPVTEERRLSGDLSEIASYAKAIPPEERFSTEQALIRKAFRVVNEKQKLTDDNRTTLQMMSRYFTAAAQERPAFIVHAANIEKMLIAETVTPENCSNCHSAVQAALWALLTPPESPPVKGGGYYLGDDPLVLSGVKQ